MVHHSHRSAQRKSQGPDMAGQEGSTEMNVGAGPVQSGGENGTLAVHSKDDIKHLQGLPVSSYPDLQTGSVITHFRQWLTFLFFLVTRKLSVTALRITFIFGGPDKFNIHIYCFHYKI